MHKVIDIDPLKNLLSEQFREATKRASAPEPTAEPTRVLPEVTEAGLLSAIKAVSKNMILPKPVKQTMIAALKLSLDRLRREGNIGI